IGRGVTADAAAIDDERREGRRLGDVERGFPAHRDAARVEPGFVAAQLFRAALVSAGVRVAGGAAHGVADESAAPLGAVDSPALALIVHWMDRVSDNFTAEMLVKELGAVQSGHGTTAAGVGVITGLLSAAGVPLAGVRLVDGSGLSLLDRLTPDALVSLLSVMWTD